jgi:hypothetical protein
MLDRPPKMKNQEFSTFENESDEADWWASQEGRAYVTRKAAEARAQGRIVRGSSLVRKLNEETAALHPDRLRDKALRQRMNK